jgi:serine protease inhibitor
VSDLSARLYAALAAEPGNLALSPHSVGVALGLAAYGARGRTRDEIRDVVGEVGRPVDGGSEVELSFANRLFGQQGLTWQADLGALLTEVDYADPEAARGVINGWTSERTHERIPEIVPAGVLDEETLLVLVNALYLKAAWLDPFQETATVAADFHLGDGTAVRVPTMLGHLGAPTGAGDGWRSVRLRYVGGALAMTVVLPDPGRLPDVEASVAARGWGHLLEAPGADRLELRLPRFTVRTSALLGEVLAGLGMATAFTDDADFSGLTEEEALKISEVLHQVFVDVDEAGTEAAAATAIAMQRAGGLPVPPVPFVVDRPFLFVVHDLEQGAALFVGRVTDPRS